MIKTWINMICLYLPLVYIFFLINEANYFIIDEIIAFCDIGGSCIY